MIQTALKSWSVQRCVERYQFTAHYTTHDNIALFHWRVVDFTRRHTRQQTY